MQQQLYQKGPTVINDDTRKQRREVAETEEKQSDISKSPVSSDSTIKAKRLAAALLPSGGSNAFPPFLFTD